MQGMGFLFIGLPSWQGGEDHISVNSVDLWLQKVATVDWVEVG